MRDASVQGRYGATILATLFATLSHSLATISPLSRYDEGHPRVRQLQLRGMQRRRNRAVVCRGRMCRTGGDDRLQRVPRCDLRPPPAIGEAIGAVQQCGACAGAVSAAIGGALGFAVGFEQRQPRLVDRLERQLLLETRLRCCADPPGGAECAIAIQRRPVALEAERRVGPASGPAGRAPYARPPALELAAGKANPLISSGLRDFVRHAPKCKGEV